MPEMTVAEIADRAGGELQGDGSAVVRGVAPLGSAGPDDLSFVSNARYASKAETTRAAAVLLPRDLAVALPEGAAGIRVDDPYVVLTWLLPRLYPEVEETPEIHPTALVHPEASVGEGVHVEPYAIVARGARVGDGARIGAHCVVGERATVGAGTRLHPHVTLYAGTVVGERCVLHSGVRLGVNGAGAQEDEGELPRPRIGACRVGDDVEIGANTVIDRGLVDDTTVGSGSKLDNLVQVARDVQVGRHVLLVAQTGVGEGARVEDGAIVGGQGGVDRNVTVGRGARVGGKSGVIGDVKPGETVSGYPARPHREAMRAQAALFRLPGVFRKLQELEKALRSRG